MQETLGRVKIEEQIMRVEEIVSLYKVNRLERNSCSSISIDV